MALDGDEILELDWRFDSRDVNEMDGEWVVALNEMDGERVVALNEEELLLSVAIS